MYLACVVDGVCCTVEVDQPWVLGTQLLCCQHINQLHVRDNAKTALGEDTFPGNPKNLKERPFNDLRGM